MSASDGVGPSSGGGVVDTAYPATPPAILKIVEAVIGLIAFSCAAHPTPWSAVHFFLFASVTAWLCTLLLFFLCLFRIPDKAGTFPWALMEFIYGVIVVFFYFLASAILSGINNGSGRVIAGAVFGFLNTLCYAVGIYFSFVQWRTQNPQPTNVVT